jgi:hypothetical protein
VVVARLISPRFDSTTRRVLARQDHATLRA